MQNEKVPEWAIARALEELGVGGQPVCHVVHGFARYIAEHEEPPVDPMLVEARKVAARAYQNCRDHDMAKLALNGDLDGKYEVVCALEGLRRGIELARKEDSHAG